MLDSGSGRSWTRRHRQALVYGLTAAALVATVAATIVGAFRLRHAVLLERQTLRTQQLQPAALELQDSMLTGATAQKQAADLVALRSAFAAVATHDPEEGARLVRSYEAFVAAAVHQEKSALRDRLAALDRRVAEELARQAAATRRVNPAARLALILAVVAAAALVSLLIFQFELERRAGRIDRDNAARAEELARLREEFVAVVSHELRTPLTSIVGYLDLLSDEHAGPLTDDQKSYLAVVLRSTERLGDLVGDLLVVAEGERAPLALEIVDLDLTTLAEHAVEAARPTAMTRGVELRVDEPESFPLRGDRTRLSQMLDNLVSNALKFTPDGGTVGLRIGHEDGQALIEVTDTGTGIHADDREHVFDPFYRARRALEQAVPGTGLGLTIVKAIVDAHHGSIEVTDGDGNVGTTFRVRLPLR